MITTIPGIAEIQQEIRRNQVWKDTFVITFDQWLWPKRPGEHVTEGGGGGFSSVFEVETLAEEEE